MIWILGGLQDLKIEMDLGGRPPRSEKLKLPEEKEDNAQ